MVSELRKYLLLYSLRVNSTNRKGYIAGLKINDNLRIIDTDMPGNKSHYGYNSYFTSSLKGYDLIIPITLIDVLK